MAGGRTTEDLSPISCGRENEGEREINARRLVYRQQSRAKSRGAHPREHCLFMRVSLFSPGKREAERKRSYLLSSLGYDVAPYRFYLFKSYPPSRASLSLLDSSPPAPLCSAEMDRGTRRSPDRRKREKARVGVREIRMNETRLSICRWRFHDKFYRDSWTSYDSRIFSAFLADAFF